MKRTHCGETNNQENDDSLDLHFQLDKCENESSKKPKTEVVETIAVAEDEGLFQSQEITLCDNVTAESFETDHTDVPKLQSMDG